jgi:ATP synthase protein I
VIGIAIGVWLDARFESAISWTLTGLVVGVLLGSLNAWYWIQRKSSER